MDKKEPTNIGKNVAKSKGENLENKKISIKRPVLQNDFACAIDGEEFLLGKFPDRYHVFSDVSGKPVLLEEYEKGLVRIVSKDKLISSIINFSIEASKNSPAYLLDIEAAKKTADHWLMSTKRRLKEMPPPFVEKSDKGLAFSRLNFDYNKDLSLSGLNYCYLRNIETRSDPGEKDIWVDIFIRSGRYWKEFAAWIGAIFVKESYNQQYLYLYGEGGNGKSSLISLLGRLIGPAFHGDSAQYYRDKHWAAAFVGKRLLAFQECKNENFILSGEFKAITGGDPVRIDQKHEKVYSIKLDTKVVISGNIKPAMQDNEAERRRAIFVELAPLSKNAQILTTQVYDALLDKSAENMINFCRAVYHSLCPRHEPISVPKAHLDDLIEETEESFQDTFDGIFELHPAGVLSAGEFSDKLKRFGYLKDNLMIKQFKAWLKKRHGIVRVQRTMNGTSKWCYEGMRSKF